MVVECHRRKGSGSYMRVKTPDFDDYKDQIVVNLNRQTGQSKPILVLNRFDKPLFFYYPLTREKIKACTDCHIPTFVEKMDRSLFKTILGVMPYTASPERYLILFNISNRFKYCMTEVSKVWHNFDFQYN